MFSFHRVALAAAALLVLHSPPVVADDAHHDEPAAPPRPDAHAPIGVMGDHTHGAGEWMLSYRYARMHMDGNRDGTDRLGLGEILLPAPGTYMAAPTEMDMQMHMFGLMVAPFDWISPTA